jgi:hypothetical protein
MTTASVSWPAPPETLVSGPPMLRTVIVSSPAPPVTSTIVSGRTVSTVS